MSDTKSQQNKQNYECVYNSWNVYMYTITFKPQFEKCSQFLHEDRNWINIGTITPTERNFNPNCFCLCCNKKINPIHIIFNSVSCQNSNKIMTVKTNITSSEGLKWCTLYFWNMLRNENRIYDPALFLLTWFNLNPAWISIYINYKVWDEISYPFPNFNGCTVEVYEWISNFILHFYSACDYLSVLGLNLNRVSKKDPRWHCQSNKIPTVVCMWRDDEINALVQG